MDSYRELNDEDFGYEFYVEDIKALARSYMCGFFAKKKLHSGGLIPLDTLESHRYLSFVMNLSISDGMGLIYATLDAQKTPTKNLEKHKKGNLEDIKYVLGLLNQCARYGIPKYFAAGIIIMYLELCEGYNVS